MKFYKHKIYKKYHDEIWGSLITSKKFSYNKRSVLLNYKDLSLRSRLRIKTKYNYFRRGFLKRLNYTNLKFKFCRKRIRLLNFFSKRGFLTKTSSSSGIFYVFKRRRRARRRFFFKRKPISSLFNSFNLLFCTKNLKNRVLASLEQDLSLRKSRFSKNAFFHLKDKRQVYFNYINFLRVNNLRFMIKKKLNLRRQKFFFYSVHIASPRKKLKKWSLYGLKNIYNKKISVFYGFRKSSDFLKAYFSALKSWGRNESSLFLALEGRLENVLFRLNYFPSVYFIKRFILSGNVFVNNRQIVFPSYYLRPGEIISINKQFHRFVYASLKSRLRSRKVLLNFPTFLETDYLIFVSMIVRKPTLSDLTLPVSFNLYTPFISVSR